MGVVDVHASPRVALRLFDDYGRLMGSVFRRIDPMFVRGRVVGTAGNRADLAAVFRLPAVVGSGAAPLFRPREFVWRQHVTRLHGGGVLVTGSSAGAAEAAPERGTVRGVLHTSGYYGQPLPGGRTRLWYVASADPALFLPGWLINLVVARQAQNAVRLAALFRTGHLVL